MERMRTLTVAFVLGISTIYLCGCGDTFWDPAQVGRFRPVPAANVILDTLGVAEETPSTWEEAEEPRPIDIMVYDTDYVFGPGDIVRISIFELFQEGMLSLDDYIVTETGKISIPDVGIVEATGLTESQLEEEIKHILSPTILKDPSVSVILLSSEQRRFSISGNGVPMPGRYMIPRYDFRLTDALAVAGGISQFNISYIYVSRPIVGKEGMAQPGESEVSEPVESSDLTVPQGQMLEPIAPRAEVETPASGEQPVVALAELTTDKELVEAASPDGFALPAEGEPNDTRVEETPEATEVEETEEGTEVEETEEEIEVEEAPGPTKIEEILESFEKPARQETIEEPIHYGEVGRIEWIFQDGKWVPVQTGRPEVAEPAVKVEKGIGRPPEAEVPEEFDWDGIGVGKVQRRVIRIPADKLSGGDPRYNIVVRPGDSIQVPVDIIGEFCIMGNVNAQGYVNITGRPMTLKMAIAAAGGLGPLAWPKRCEVVRRISKNKEEIVMVDLGKIARGEQPDFFIKPNDLINVGTHPTSRWRAVLRNAFRATYGFGFVYDRNFADRDYGTRRPIPHWF